MNEDDAVLARRWQEGDGQAAARTAARYADALGAIAYGILGDASLCEDVVQESFARASRRIHSLKNPERLGGFLVGIARHVALDMARKRKRETVGAAEQQAVGEQHAAPGTPRQDAVRAELRDRLRQAVSGLPEDQRDLFLMKYMSGLRYSEIANTLGMTQDAVGQKLWRIRQKLQRELKDFRP